MLVSGLLFRESGEDADFWVVFQELPMADRSRLLSQLAAKVFSHAVGS